MKTKLFFLTIAMMFLAIPMFAQGGGAPAAGGNPLVPVTAGIAMAIASGLCALGMGKAIAGAAEGAARNPGAFPAFALLSFSVLPSSSRSRSTPWLSYSSKWSSRFRPARGCPSAPPSVTDFLKKFSLCNQYFRAQQRPSLAAEGVSVSHENKDG